ncbi:MAG TPA: glycosyltransferase [Steroidobacter sp.]|nr:glycosyltransferase [Steroidobacter sp.]
MKVLMTADAVGGVWTYAMELSGALQACEVDVVLAVMGPAPNLRQLEQARRLSNLRLHSFDAKLEWMADPWEDVDRAGRWLLELARAEQPDLVHLNGYAHAALSWDRPVLVVAHSCVCSWWRAVHAQPAPSEWDEYRRRIAAGARAAHAVVAPTRAFLEDFVRRYAPCAPGVVIHNGCSANTFARDQHRARAPVVLACGRLWDEAKNMSTLDAAARNLPWPVFAAGERTAPDGRVLRAAHLSCLGTLSQPELYSRLERSAIYVHPAKYEPFGLAVLEAALAGCALVLSDLPTLRELWDGAALFTPAVDAGALHGALRELIEEPALRRGLAARAAARAACYAPEAMAQNYLSQYRRLAQRRPLQGRAFA